MTRIYMMLLVVGFLGISCGAEDGPVVLNSGVPGQTSGFLFTLEGQPLHDVTVWIEDNSAPALYGPFLHVETEGCHDPLTPAEHGVCSQQNGFFQMECDGEDSVTLKLADLDGEALPDVTAECGGPTENHFLDVEHHD